MQISGGHTIPPRALSAYREFEQCPIAVEMNDTAQYDCGIHVAHMRCNQRGFRVKKPLATYDFAIAAETSFGPPFPNARISMMTIVPELPLCLLGLNSMSKP